MLAGKRAVRVGDLIMREVAQILLDRVRDPRVGGVTITGIRMSDDLKNCRVYFSVIGGEDQVQTAQQGLDHARGFIRREIGARLDLRYVPDIIFTHDATLERGSRIDQLLADLKAHDAG